MIAFDLGGTWLRCAKVSDTWSVSNKILIQTPKDGEKIAEIVADYCRKFPDDSDIGFSVAGIIDDKKSIFLKLTNLDVHNFNFEKVFFEKTGKKCVIIHDASAMALGEMVAGCAKGEKNFIYVTLSTGIGGAFVSNGKILQGEHGFAGEVGHMTLLPNGPLCGCGKHGCWESLASGSALARLGLNMVEVFKRAESNEPEAIEIVDDIAYWHGVGLANLANAFDPPFIMLGGGQTNSFPIIETRLLSVLKDHLYPERSISGFIKLSTLGDEAALIGAAYNVLRR